MEEYKLLSSNKYLAAIFKQVHTLNNLLYNSWSFGMQGTGHATISPYLIMADKRKTPKELLRYTGYVKYKWWVHTASWEFFMNLYRWHFRAKKLSHCHKIRANVPTCVTNHNIHCCDRIQRFSFNNRGEAKNSIDKSWLSTEIRQQ
jgi:hypothetical protein